MIECNAEASEEALGEGEVTSLVSLSCPDEVHPVTLLLRSAQALLSHNSWASQARRRNCCSNR